MPTILMGLPGEEAFPGGGSSTAELVAPSQIVRSTKVRDAPLSMNANVWRELLTRTRMFATAGGGRNIMS
jgi:hypothetical protein